MWKLQILVIISTLVFFLDPAKKAIITSEPNTLREEETVSLYFFLSSSIFFQDHVISKSNIHWFKCDTKPLQYPATFKPISHQSSINLTTLLSFVFYSSFSIFCIIMKGNEASLLAYPIQASTFFNKVKFWNTLPLMFM